MVLRKASIPLVWHVAVGGAEAVRGGIGYPLTRGVITRRAVFAWDIVTKSDVLHTQTKVGLVIVGL